MIDCGASSSATLSRSYFINGTCEEIKVATMSGIAACSQASDVGPILLPLKDDRGDEINFQTDKVLRLEKKSRQC